MLSGRLAAGEAEPARAGPAVVTGTAAAAAFPADAASASQVAMNTVPENGRRGKRTGREMRKGAEIDG